MERDTLCASGILVVIQGDGLHLSLFIKYSHQRYGGEFPANHALCQAASVEELNRIRSRAVVLDIVW